MSDNKVIKAGIGYTVGNYLLKGLSFLTVPLFARLLTTEDFGIYSTFIAYESILFIVLSVAIHSSYKNAKYKYTETYNTYISATIIMLIVNAVVLLIIGNLFSGWFCGLLELDRLSLNLLIIYSFSTAVLYCFNADVSLRYSYKSYLLVSSINAIGNLALSVVFILTLFNDRRYMGRIIGTVLPIFLIAVVICIRFIRIEKPNNTVSYLKWGVSYSFPIVFHGLSQVILSQFDRIMIRRINGEYSVGLYSFGYTIFSIINVTFNSTDSVWNTWFYEKLSADKKESIKKYSTYYIFLILILCLFVIIVCPELIDILGGSKYYESRYCTIPIVASGFFVFLYTLPASVEYYYAKTKRIAIATIIAAGINIGLNYIFILKYGYIAAAYTTLFTYILYFIFHYIQARRIMGCNLFSNSAIILSSVVLGIVMVLSYMLMDYIVIRWIIGVFILGIGLFYEEKKMKLVSRIIHKMTRRRS